MKTIKAQIRGVTPLLMNSPKAMLEPEEGLKQTTKAYDSKGQAEKLAYRTKEGELYIPSEAIKGAIINASSFKKIGKYSAKTIMAGGIFVTPSEIGLGIKDYELDARTVVIRGRGRVVKVRPKITDWKADFEILYNENLISNPGIIKAILIEAGQRIGILDFRPQKSGSFGMFEITKWEEE